MTKENEKKKRRIKDVFYLAFLITVTLVLAFCIVSALHGGVL